MRLQQGTLYLQTESWDLPKAMPQRRPRETPRDHETATLSHVRQKYQFHKKLHPKYIDSFIYLILEKNSNPRIFKLSHKLIERLNRLAKTSEKIFGEAQLDHHRNHFCMQRKRIAAKLRNPRLNQITFRTLRHWKATMEYHKTKDILHVMQMLGHKNIMNTLKYTQLVDFQGDEYTSKATKDSDEASELVEAGFEYVCTTPDEIMLFRKRR